MQRNEGHGHLLVIDRNTFQLVKQTGRFLSKASAPLRFSALIATVLRASFPTAVTQSSVTRLLWHPRLNQVSETR